MRDLQYLQLSCKSTSDANNSPALPRRMAKSVFAETPCVARLANSFVSRLSIAATGETFTAAGVLIPLQLLKSKLTRRGRSAVKPWGYKFTSFSRSVCLSQLTQTCGGSLRSG
ncbi:hypothetical protein H634G_11437 [Metarhizium anisopliae BRIP 53293]|uniref:Uncharacterized protein n=1 Tax=Metarhizium anisopliae BRIP 53293 TaxID=1291518 RepID=A0A0D9NL72_METAN|nr:hypothetical protein H634G_11437 [Metarhizium anisopliae BRIP 53293]